MKASELRIGNYIKQPNGVNVVFRISEGEDVNTFPEEEIDPIPLSEEWLLKFGFKKINHINGYSFYSLSNSKVNKCHIDIYENRTHYMGYNVSHCEYVHQLQNLYFALTGEELTLKSE